MLKNSCELATVTKVANYVKNTYPKVATVSIPTTEDFGPDFYIKDTKGKIHPCEVKTLRKPPFKIDGNFNEIWKPNKIKFEDIPDISITPDKLTYWERTKELTGTTIPTHIQDKYVTILNGTDKYNGTQYAKGPKIYRERQYLFYYNITSGELIHFNPKELQEAFLGYGWTYNYRKTDFYCEPQKDYELKVILDLEKGKYEKNISI